jgi:hypothetical protein
LPSQLEFDRRDIPRVVAALVAAAKQAIFALVPAALGLLALILTVAEVQTVGAAIVPGCFGNRGLSCRGTKSSNPSPSSGESADPSVPSGGRIGNLRPCRHAYSNRRNVKRRDGSNAELLRGYAGLAVQGAGTHRPDQCGVTPRPRTFFARKRYFKLLFVLEVLSIFFRFIISARSVLMTASAHLTRIVSSD